MQHKMILSKYRSSLTFPHRGLIQHVSQAEQGSQHCHDRYNCECIPEKPKNFQDKSCKQGHLAPVDSPVQMSLMRLKEKGYSLAAEIYAVSGGQGVYSRFVGVVGLAGRATYWRLLGSRLCFIFCLFHRRLHVCLPWTSIAFKSWFCNFGWR